jgi:hypothetical protein
VRLVERNRERFAKRIVAGPRAAGRLVLAPDASDELVRIMRVLRSWPDDGGTCAVLARTNRELLPAVVAALELRRPFRAPDLALPLEDPRLDELLGRAAAVAAARPKAPLLLILGMLRDHVASAATGDEPPDDGPTLADLAGALLAWAPAHAGMASLVTAVEERRARLAELRRDDAPLSLATAHGTKGLEWDHVAVLADGFPGRRSVTEAAEPERALEEERRLAYVAWTRARRSLTLLFDPASPSPFLLEAFSSDELGLEPAA